MTEQSRPISPDTDKATRDTISQMIRGYVTSQPIFVAIKLGIPDLLHEEPKNCDDLARAVGVNPSALYRLLSLLAANGILREVFPQHFAITPMGTLLQQGVAFRPTAMMQSELYWRAYGELLYCLKTGHSHFEHAFGMPIMEYLGQNPEVDAVYVSAMTTATIRVATALTASYDFTGVRTVVDIGGSQGVMLSEIRKAHPHLWEVLDDKWQFRTLL